MFQRQKCRTPVSNANMTLLSDKIDVIFGEQGWCSGESTRFQKQADTG